MGGRQDRPVAAGLALRSLPQVPGWATSLVCQWGDVLPPRAKERMSVEGDLQRRRPLWWLSRLFLFHPGGFNPPPQFRVVPPPFFSFLGPHLQHMEVPRPGVKWSHSCQLTPQPQQHPIRASSATHTACSSWQQRIPDPLSKARDRT